MTSLIIAAALVCGILYLKKGNFAGIPSQHAQRSGTKSKGPENAPVQIVEYSDFQCPACMKAQAPLAALLKEYPDKIHITFMHYPLPMHPWAGIAHQAAECANRQGKFWEFHDRVYKEQPVWTVAPNPSESLISYARDAGVDLDTFGACLSDPNVTKTILDEKESGQKLQVASTPTFFINGERVVGQIELETTGRAVIRKALGLPPETPMPATAAHPAPVPAAAASAKS